ncbi:MAG: DNA repair protein RadA [Firmicutes bacterium]|nr:DNA repair protein RadA [Bacillota bacterium]
MRDKIRFFCTACGHETLKWGGQCPGCSAWNSMVEQMVSKAAPRHHPRRENTKPIPLVNVRTENINRIPTGSRELDRVLGGGLVPGSVVLVGGDPGIGKSTLLLAVGNAIAAAGRRVVYASGEESMEQLKMRAERLQAECSELYATPETDVAALLDQVQAIKGEVLVVDSIQTMSVSELASATGSIGQVRESAARMIRVAKETGVAVVLVGHVTKDGAIAGPKLLEHMVDAVLYFEGDKHMSFRLLRAVKNRFGATSEVGVFSMCGNGLRDVDNPSELLLAERPADVVGSVVVPIIEGTRPMLIEIQALLAPTGYGTPRRTTAGVESNRVAMILAVLERRVGLDVSFQDSYVNAVGGIRVLDTAADLAVAVSLASSLRNTRVNRELAVVGEVGLTGEVRGVGRIEGRITEAAKLGFKRIIIPKRNAAEAVSLTLPRIQVHPVETLAAALTATWGL